jgi:hypothetical protein
VIDPFAKIKKRTPIRPGWFVRDILARKQGTESAGRTTRFIDLTGQRFGRLFVLARAINRGKVAVWQCQCDCGQIKIIPGRNLRDGISQSCGCLQRERSSANCKATKTKHGYKGTPTYTSWIEMRRRCSRSHRAEFRNYGARGISVCQEWLNSFEAFLRDMGTRPEGKSLDRINNDGNYEPGNCRWATLIEQRRNRRPSKSKRREA